MAEANNTAQSFEANDLIVADGKITLSQNRVGIALEAAEEIDSLSGLLRLIQSDDLENIRLAVRGVSLRIEELNSIIISSLAENAESSGDLSCRLRGRAGL